MRNSCQILIFIDLKKALEGELNSVLQFEVPLIVHVYMLTLLPGHLSLLVRGESLGIRLYCRTGFNCENLIIANCEFFYSQPQLNQRPTRTWQVGDVIYSPHEMQLTGADDALPPGTYQAAVQVYYVGAAGLVNLRTETGEELVIVDSLNIADKP